VQEEEALTMFSDLKPEVKVATKTSPPFLQKAAGKVTSGTIFHIKLSEGIHAEMQ